MSKIKICGIFREIDIACLNTALPDYAGFIFANSKRQVDPELANLMRQALHPDVKTVGVFVNSDIKEILKIVNEGTINLIQLHGNEDENYIKELKTKTDLPIIKAFYPNDIDEINTCADYILLDNKNEKGFGGLGEAFNWQKIPKMNKPFFLAGGIDINNVDEALKLNSHCIDVSSGVETNNKKDFHKIMEMVKKVKNGEN